MYVDDNALACPDEQEVDFEAQKILEALQGRVIEPGIRGYFPVWDMLGSDLWYSRAEFAFRMTMET